MIQLDECKTDFVGPYLGDIILSSPEHEVLRVRYCDRAVSVVRRQLFTSYMLKRPHFQSATHETWSETCLP